MITLLVVAGVVIAVAGTRLATVADQLADRTGMGEAIAGAVFVGGATSLPGLLTTIIAAAEGLPTLAVSNALGGIAVQTLWLVVGDAFLRRANLEHAAAAPENIFQGALLVALLSLPLLAMSAPPFTLFGFLHPVSILLPALWFFGMRMMREVRKHPMWRPLQTPDTVLDEPNEDDDGKLSARQLWISFLGLALILGGAGWALAESGGEIVERTALSESVVGALFTATLSSTPELVVVIAAVRQGAHTLAISNIIGG
ncbi:MAG: sodium:calcium antiporter, partial [Verrucomicrobiota bacterium]